MKSENQNKFYTSISKYYSEIFPFNPAQLNFVKNRAEELAGKQILDIGCATGELAYQLANEGANVTGIDLNEDLLKQAKENRAHPNCYFLFGNMLNLKTDFEPGQFDVVLCFGNTLVHLEDQKQIKLMLEGVYSVLKPGGYFLLQILNYDYILDEQVFELPIIETDTVKFVRKYLFKENSGQIIFQTDLHLMMENQVISNETELLSLKSKDLKDLLIQENFREIKFYSSFKIEPFGGRHLPLVASCLKK